MRYTNDYYPIFDQSTLRDITFYENATISNVLHTVKASDADVGLAGTIKYSINDPTNTLSISQTTGEITLLKLLDRETISSYSVTISASDKAPSPFNLETSQDVIITVGDVNDNTPTFGKIDLPVLIDETVKVNTTAYKIITYDLDAGTNAEVEFSVLSTNDSNGYFELTQETGNFIVRSMSLQ